MKFAETTLAARRALRDVGLRFDGVRAICVRWFRAPRAPQADLILSRTSIDAAMRGEIRAVVDHAIGVYRADFVRRLRALLAERQDRAGPIEPQFAPAPPPPPARRPRFDEAELRQAFQRAARPAGSAQ